MITRAGVLVLCLLAGVAPASAQSWSFDARKIGLGSPGGNDSLTGTTFDLQTGYRAIVLPFGLLQLLGDRDKINSDNDEFDLMLAIDYATGPLHYTFGRGSTTAGHQLAVDVRNARLSRDLNRYRGFVPANQPRAEGVSAPTWGSTFIVHRGQRGGVHGVYVGAGPYFSFRNDVGIDQQLIDILASTSDVYLANTQMRVNNVSMGQTALSMTGGYRARVALPAASRLSAVSFGIDYHYLRGFRYENEDLSLRLDTDSGGLLTINPQVAQSLAIVRDTATTGRGMAVDVGAGVVAGPWQVGFNAAGIGNRVDWRNAERITYTLPSVLFGSGDFIRTAPVSIGDVRVEQPVDYRGTVAYENTGWTAVAQLGHGLGGRSLRGGLEYRLRPVDLRAGAVYSREQWNPAGGIGLTINPRVALDVALYGNSANVERVRRPAIAVSLRLTS